MMFSILALSLAGFTQGMTGFGFGLIAISLLPMIMDLKEAAAVTALLNLVVTGSTFFSLRHHYSWRRGLGLVLGACLGVPLGVFVLVELDEGLLLRILGGAMLLLSANELLLSRTRSIPMPPRLGIAFGLMSGGLSGAFSMGGPPAIAFTYAQPWTKEQIVAVLQVVFGASAVLRLVLLSQAGLVAPPLLRLSLLTVLPLVLAIGLGQKLFARLPQPILKQATFLFLAVMGIKYLVFV